MKKWTQKLAKEVKETFQLEPKFPAGQGRRLGGGDAGPSQPPAPSVAHHAAGSGPMGKGVGTGKASSVSPYEAILRSIGDEACIAAMATMLEKVDKGKQQREETQESMRVLRKILSNVIADPENGKVRTLRLANAKIERFVVKPPGARALLLGCGFVEESGRDTGGDACLVISRDVARENSRLMSRIVRVIENLLGIKPEEKGAPGAGAAKPDSMQSAPQNAPVKIVGDGRRNTMLELPTCVEDADLPEEFYEQSLAEVHQLYKHNRELLEQSKLLMTKAQREKLRSSGGNTVSKGWVRVRVRAPEAVKVVGDFDRDEPLQALFAWVAECLNDHILEFDLVTPPPERRSIGNLRFDSKSTIRDAFGNGDVTLNLLINSGEGGQAVSGRGPTFRSDGLPS